MVTDQLSWGKYIKRRVSHYIVINIIDHLHGAYLPENSCNMVSGVYTYGRRAIMEVDGVLHSTTLPPSQFVFYGQGPNVPLGKPNSKLFVIIPLSSSSSSLHTVLSINMCSCAGPDVADGQWRARELFVAVTEPGKEGDGAATSPAARPNRSLP